MKLLYLPIVRKRLFQNETTCWFTMKQNLSNEKITISYFIEYL